MQEETEIETKEGKRMLKVTTVQDNAEISKLYTNKIKTDYKIKI